VHRGGVWQPAPDTAAVGATQSVLAVLWAQSPALTCERASSAHASFRSHMWPSMWPWPSRSCLRTRSGVAQVLARRAACRVSRDKQPLRTLRSCAGCHVYVRVPLRHHPYAHTHVRPACASLSVLPVHILTAIALRSPPQALYLVSWHVTASAGLQLEGCAGPCRHWHFGAVAPRCASSASPQPASTWCSAQGWDDGPRKAQIL
jgi:hypothetical protein